MCKKKKKKKKKQEIRKRRRAHRFEDGRGPCHYLVLHVQRVSSAGRRQTGCTQWLVGCRKRRVGRKVKRVVSTLKDGVSLGDTSRIPHSARTRISTHVETDVTLVGVTICNITPLPLLPLALARPRLFSISDPVFIERHGTDAKQVFSVWYGTVI